MSRSAEDQLCTQRIQFVKNQLENQTIIDIETEKHYNHYGDRGVADLFVRTEYPSGEEDDHVYEFKSDAAIKNSTGANEILRQFHRMCAYFYKDESISLPNPTAWENAEITFELCFNATPYAFEHVIENHDIYQTVSTPAVQGGLRDAKSIIMLRSLDGQGGPVPVASSNDSCYMDRDCVRRMAAREFGSLAKTGVGADV